MASATAILTSNKGPVQFGQGGTISWTGSPGTLSIVSASFSRKGDTVDVSAQGIYFASAAVNPMDTLDVEIIWSDATGGATQATLLAELALPTTLKTLITVTGSDAMINGTWNYEGASQPRSNGEFVRTSFSLSRKGNDATTTLPTSLAIVS
jgi:hypothetical protein